MPLQRVPCIRHGTAETMQLSEIEVNKDGHISPTNSGISCPGCGPLHRLSSCISKRIIAAREIFRVLLQPGLKAPTQQFHFLRQPAFGVNLLLANAQCAACPRAA